MHMCPKYVVLKWYENAENPYRGGKVLVSYASFGWRVLLHGNCCHHKKQALPMGSNWSGVRVCTFKLIQMANACQVATMLRNSKNYVENAVTINLREPLCKQTIKSSGVSVAYCAFHSMCFLLFDLRGCHQQSFLPKEFKLLLKG